MKKLFILSLTLLVSIFLVACNEEKDRDSAKKTEDANQTPAETKSSQPEKEPIDMELTLPAILFEGEEIDEMIADAKEDGVEEAIKNEDGSLTLRMSKSVHQRFMEDLKEVVNEMVEEVKTDEEFTYIQDVTHNNDFTEFTLTVNKELFENSLDTLAIDELALTGVFYHIFNNVEHDQIKMAIIIKDASTGEVIETFMYPDDFE